MYTVSGFVPLGSSPLAMPSSGNRSMKRGSVSARGAAVAPGNQPRLSFSSSIGGSLLEQAVNTDTNRGSEALLKHFSLSGSRRRSVASSPTEGSECRARVAAPVVQTQFGFQVQDLQPQNSPQSSPFMPTSENPFSWTQPSGQQQQQGQRPLAKGSSRPGLLSLALTHEEDAIPQPLQQSLPSLSKGLVSMGSAYFPDVDTGLLEDLQERHEVFHTELVSTAYMLASKAHAGQQRKDGTSQLSHCVLVALQLADLGLDAECVAAGLLHDALRASSNTFRAQVEEFMPASVIQLIDRVQTITEISSLYRKSKGQLDEERMRSMLLAMEDVKAMLVKLACRVHDMKTVSALPRDTQLLLAQETLDIFSVVANRLGVWSVKAELEDLAFAVLHPEEYEALKAQVSRRQDPAALEATIAKIQARLAEKGVRCEDISGRPKNLYGIWTKMRDGRIQSLDQVYDVTALRVVVANKHDCYVALRAVTELYKCMPGRSKDYIRGEKKPNGYQSLHETIYGEDGLLTEVQIRTHKMHYIAEYGFAAHWKYKERLPNEDEWLDKEVQYKKWLTAYKLGVHDHKVRASGAPQRDKALESLGIAHVLDPHAQEAPASPPVGSPAETPSATTSRISSLIRDKRQLLAARSNRSSTDGTAQAVPVTGSAPAAPGTVDPFLRHDRFKLQPPQRQKVSVILQTQDDGASHMEFPAGMSAAEVAEHLGVSNLPGYALTINFRLQDDSYCLQTSDLLQIVPVADALSRSPPQQQQQRVPGKSGVPVSTSQRLSFAGASAASSVVPATKQLLNAGVLIAGAARRRDSYATSIAAAGSTAQRA